MTDKAPVTVAVDEFTTSVLLVIPELFLALKETEPLFVVLKITNAPSGPPFTLRSPELIVRLPLPIDTLFPSKVKLGEVVATFDAFL